MMTIESRRKNGSTLDALCLFVLFLNLTFSHGALAYITGNGDAKYISIIYTLFFLIYALSNVTVVKNLLKNSLFTLMTVFILVAPILLSIAQYIRGVENIEGVMYYGGLNIMFGGMFIASALYGYRKDRRSIKQLGVMSIIFILFEFYMNYTQQDLVRDIIRVVSDRYASIFDPNRLRGFFPNQNEAAISIVVLFWIVAMNNKFRVTAKDVIWFMLCIVMIVPTGARTSMLLMILSLCLLAIRGVISEGSRFTPKLMLAIPACILVFAALAWSMLIISSYNSSIENSISRFANLLGGVFGQEGGYDQSYQIRSRLLDQYTEIIQNNRMLGIGFSRISTLITNGYMEEVSQVSIIQWAAEYGVLYALLAVFTLCVLILTSLRLVTKPEEARWAGADLLVITVIIVVASLSFVDLFFMRSIVIICGLVVGRACRSLSTNAARQHDMLHYTFTAKIGETSI